MRVALDATPLTLSSGGLQRYVSELSLALARQFPEDCYTLLSDQPFDPPAGAPRNLVPGPAPNSVMHRKWWTFGLRRELRNCGAQLFHGTNFEVPYFGRAPSLLTIHDLSPWRDRTWHTSAGRVRGRTPWLIRLGRAHRILTVSDAVRREVIARFRVSPARVAAIPLAASESFRPTNAGPVHPRPFFLFVGTVEPRKNVPALIEAWRQSRAATGADLLLAGRLRSDAPPLEPAEGLYFKGELPDSELPALYSQALAFVYPTLYEGFGLPVLEAMQCGCPVITSRDPAVMEVSESAALYAGPIDEIAQAMKSVANDAILRAGLRERGLRRAADFSWQRTATLTRALYAEMLGANAA